MFLNFLTHLLNFDIPWLVALVMNNLPFLFMFAAIVYFFFEGKKLVLGVILLSLVVWVWQDFTNASGTVLFVASFLMLHYITRLAVVAFAESVPSLKGRLVLVLQLQVIALFVFFNLFLR